MLKLILRLKPIIKGEKLETKQFGLLVQQSKEMESISSGILKNLH